MACKTKTVEYIGEIRKTITYDNLYIPVNHLIEIFTITIIMYMTHLPPNNQNLCNEVL